VNHDPNHAHDHTQAPPAGALKDPDVYIELTLGDALHARIWLNGPASDTLAQILAFANPARPAPGPRRGGLEPQLLPLIEAGLLRPGEELTWHWPRLHRTETVTVTADGRIKVPDGSAWPSPFQAAHRIAGYQGNGWVYFKTADGRSLQELKTSLENREPAPGLAAAREQHTA
jgi:hypothetical protein